MRISKKKYIEKLYSYIIDNINISQEYNNEILRCIIVADYVGRNSSLGIILMRFSVLNLIASENALKQVHILRSIIDKIS